MITIHAYRSWTEDNPHGYFQRGGHGVKPANPDLANKRSRIANHPPHRFSKAQQQLIINESLDITNRRVLRLHAVSCTPTHAHLIVSWFGKESLFNGINEPLKQAKYAAAKTKNILSTLLSKQDGTTGKRWFSRGHDCTPVDDREHLNHLIEDYLPKHAKEGGMFRVCDKGDTAP